MIRIAFPNPSLAKANYWRSLLNGITALPGGLIEPVILLGTRTDMTIKQDPPPVRLIRSRFLDEDSRFGAARKTVRRHYGFDLALEWVCRINGIQMLSHWRADGYLRPRSKVRTIGWIYDFQHKHLPDYFSREVLRRRDEYFAELCRYCDRVLVSSDDALQDFATFLPDGLGKARVLRFVGATNAMDGLATVDELRTRYALPPKFFALPNQFWIHKNHRVVLEALVQLRERGRVHCVVATGLPADPRHPNYYRQFVDDIQRLRLDAQFLILGLIPHKDVLALVRHSVGVINPSLFEGWSASVEEGKALGKRVLLSSIGVHREQSPERGVFFDPKDPRALAEAMATSWDEFDPMIEDAQVQAAMARFPERLRELGRVYQDIALELANEPR